MATIELPLWAEEIRPYQMKALQDVLAQYAAGNTIAVMDAPTGAGKTLIGELVRQSLGVRALYLCSSLSLQEQFVRDFPHAALLKGRSNYATCDAPDEFPSLTAWDCSKEKVHRLPACSQCNQNYRKQLTDPVLHCRWCHPIPECGYEQAKAKAMSSMLVCTNTSYFLHEANFVGSIPLNRKLIIVDEADLLEDHLLSFVSVQISKRRAEELDIEPPAKKTVESAWIEWAIYAEKHLSMVRKSARYLGNSVDSIRDAQSLDSLIQSVHRLNNRDSGLSAGGWVYTGYDKGDIAFKPISVDTLAYNYLWRHCDRWLLMSATTISPSVMMESLGL